MYDFIISDTHFFHKNLIKYTGRPENHNELMAANWRKIVGEDQTVLHLGDVLMGYHELWPKIKQLPGKVSVLNSGNHDQAKKKAWLQENWGWRFIPEFTIEYRGWDVLFSHWPIYRGVHPLQGGGRSINVHGHIHQRPDPSPFHINVSVERMDYRPVKLRELLDTRIEKLEEAAMFRDIDELGGRA